MKLTTEQTEQPLAALQLSTEIRARLETALSTYESLSTDAKLLQEAADLEKSLIGKLLADHGYDKVVTDAFALCWIKGATTSKIEPKKLLAAGVSFAQIEQATVVRPKKPYFQIRSRKAAAADSDDE